MPCAHKKFFGEQKGKFYKVMAGKIFCPSLTLVQSVST